MKKWWQNLPVSKKLYGVVGVMALLIATELGTLYFAMTTLSAVRGFVGGEGVWSKAQKTAVYNLHRYASTFDVRYYEAFEKQLEIPLGDRVARLEIEKRHMDMAIVKKGFLAGGIHPNDIEPMVKLVRRFNAVPHLALAVEQWQKGDVLIDELIQLGAQLRDEVKKGQLADKWKVEAYLEEIAKLDEQLTYVENQFSFRLGEASRWLEQLLMVILLTLVVTVEATGLFLTFKFARSLTRNLNELNDAAVQVGEGNLNLSVPVRSKDELGLLASSLNSMIENLKKQITGRKTAEHASETKNLFLANMSHEIRTPLSAILGFSELLANPDVSEADRKRYGAIIQRTGHSLTNIINDILDISKVEAEQIEIEKKTFSLPLLIADLQRILRLRSEEKGVDLIFEKKGDVADLIYSDPSRLRQILANIIGNSIKFTEAGSVRVIYEAKNDKLVFQITDTGGGIPPENVTRLFRPFSQGDDSIRKKFGGAGLGLMISRRLAELLGGNVYLAENVPGEGATFEIAINYEPAQADDLNVPLQELPALEDKPLKGKKLLVVEDATDNQLLAHLFLTRAGAEVEFAHNGKAGIEKALSTQYDVILMDIQMPVLDGYTATRELRRRNIKTPIIALTGFAMKEDRQRCLEVGCNGYLSKPFDREKLIRSVLEQTTRTP